MRSAPIRLRFARVLVLGGGLVAAPSSAHAEGWLGATMGAGVEAASRRGDAPTAVGSWGATFGWLPSRGHFGIGLATALVARTSTLFESHLAVHSDLMLHVASADRRVRGGVGLGLRTITLTPPEQPSHILLGADLVHAELTTPLHRWTARGGDGALTLDAFATFTLGCYRGRLEEGDLRDSPAVTVGCADTLAATFVAGIGIGLATRRR